jgi:hypothetical protein
VGFFKAMTHFGRLLAFLALVVVEGHVILRLVALH